MSGGALPPRGFLFLISKIYIMENWNLEKILYYQVNGKKFFSEEKAEEYALKVFLVEELNKYWKKLKTNLSAKILTDNNTIQVTEYHEPYVDNCNLGHYCCSHPEVYGRNIYKLFPKLSTIGYKYAIEEIIKNADSINLKMMEVICDTDTVAKYERYKAMIDKLRYATGVAIKPRQYENIRICRRTSNH